MTTGVPLYDTVMYDDLHVSEDSVGGIMHCTQASGVLLCCSHEYSPVHFALAIKLNVILIFFVSVKPFPQYQSVFPFFR